jgi:hypothetical protein
MEMEIGVPVDQAVMRAQTIREATKKEEQRKATRTGATTGKSVVQQTTGGIGVTFEGTEQDTTAFGGPEPWMSLPIRDMTNTLPIPASDNDMGFPPYRSNTYKELGETVMSWLSALMANVEHLVPMLTQPTMVKLGVPVDGVMDD